MSAAKDAGMPVNPQLQSAREIRPVVQHYLKTSQVEARQQLPSDFAHFLPQDAGEPREDPLHPGRFSLPPWWLTIEGDRAELNYVPPGGMTPHMRLWFSLDLERKSGKWKVSPEGVTFAHANARRP